MRQLIKQFVEICVEVLPVSGKVYEFGSLQVPGQEGFADLRPFFAGKEFIGADYREGPGVDQVLDLHDIDLPDGKAGLVLSFDTFEHVEFPRKAISEVHRILEDGGIFVFSSVMKFPIHDYPHDYWRFTPEAFRSLLSIFDYSFVECCGEPDFPHTVVGIGVKGSIPDHVSEALKKRMTPWKKYWSRSDIPGWHRFITFLLPPFLLMFYRKIRTWFRRS